MRLLKGCIQPIGSQLNRFGLKWRIYIVISLKGLGDKNVHHNDDKWMTFIFDTAFLSPHSSPKKTSNHEPIAQQRNKCMCRMHVPGPSHSQWWWPPVCRADTRKWAVPLAEPSMKKLTKTWKLYQRKLTPHRLFGNSSPNHLPSSSSPSIISTGTNPSRTLKAGVCAIMLASASL